MGVDDKLVFGANRIETGRMITHIEDSTTFKINRCGYYLVSFNGDAAFNCEVNPQKIAESEFLTVQLKDGDVDIPGAKVSILSDGVQNLAFSTIVYSRPSCCAVDNDTSLTFVNTGAEAVYSNVNVVITRLC